MIQEQFSIYVVIPAAGIGSRMQADKAKQYLPLLDKTILENTLNCFVTLPFVEQVIVALHPQDQLFSQLAIASNPKIKTVVGGKERADSVLAGIRTITQQDAWVMVHDAARPCLTRQDIMRLLSACNEQSGAILASRVRDTMKRSNNDALVLQTESRENLWHALTPQCFNVRQLRDSLQLSLEQEANITDEASAMEYCGHSVKLVEGSDRNIKITRPEDLQLAEFYLTRIKQEER